MLLLFKYALHGASVLFLIGLSLRLHQGLDKFYNFTVAVYFTVCPFVLHTLIENLGAPLLASLCVSLVAVGILGLMLELIIFHPLRERRASTGVRMIVSIVLAAMLSSLSAIIWGDETRYFSLARVLKPVVGSASFFTPLTLLVLTTCAVISILMIVWLRHTSYGKEFRAISSSPELAQIVGINVRIVSATISVIAAFVAGFAGVLEGIDTSISPSMGLDAILGGLLVAVLANSLSVPRLAIMAFSVGALFCAVGYLLRVEWQSAISFALLLVVIAMRSFGWFEWCSERVRSAEHKEKGRVA